MEMNRQSRSLNSIRIRWSIKGQSHVPGQTITRRPGSAGYGSLRIALIQYHSCHGPRRHTTTDHTHRVAKHETVPFNLILWWNWGSSRLQTKVTICSLVLISPPSGHVYHPLLTCFLLVYCKMHISLTVCCLLCTNVTRLNYMDAWYLNIVQGPRLRPR